MDSRPKVFYGGLLLTTFSIALSAVAGEGEDVAAQMTQYYYSQSKNCGPDKPAYVCGGLLIRGTEHSKDYKVWNPSPTSQKNGGVSFSYLRADSKYDRLGYSYYNGYVLKPPGTVPVKEEKLTVLCIFPIDAYTDDRANLGCGDHANTPEIEKLCNESGVDSAQKWYNQFYSFPASPRSAIARPRSCGYDAREESGSSAATNFNTALEAMRLLGNKSFHTANEVRIKTWEQNKQDTLPILAFIYTKPSGLASAQLDQRDMMENSAQKRWIPVIRIELPKYANKEATFTYNAQDQAVLPSPGAACTRYIESAVWRDTFVREINKTVAQLSITPTRCAREMDLNGVASAMNELKAFRNEKWDVSRDKSMETQLRCLRGLYPNKTQWNIEPFRPNVNDEEANKYGCNPFGTPDEDPTDKKPEAAENILERVMENYNNVVTSSNACTEDNTNNERGHYYCSGVLVRTLGGTDYRPWDYSPNAVKMGSTSYSWIRKDVKIKRLYHPAGFILRAPTDAIAQNIEPLDVGWECLYAFDASTSVANGSRGCDFRFDNTQIPGSQLNLPNRNAKNVYGSCAEVKVKNASGWSSFMQNGQKKLHDQCSWDPEYPPYWDAMIALQKSNKLLQFPWNELLLKNLSTTADGSRLQPHIEAYFYDVRRKTENARISAQAYQLRTKQETGGFIPIFRIDFQAPPSKRFTYVEIDQLPLCDKNLESSEWRQYTDSSGIRRDSLYVVPTACAKAQIAKLTLRSKTYAIPLMGAEIFRSNSKDAQWTRAGGKYMMWQLSCNIWRNKTAEGWSLEPHRGDPKTYWWGQFETGNPPANCDY